MKCRTRRSRVSRFGTSTLKWAEAEDAPPSLTLYVVEQVQEITG